MLGIVPVSEETVLKTRGMEKERARVSPFYVHKTRRALLVRFSLTVLSASHSIEKARNSLLHISCRSAHTHT